MKMKNSNYTILYNDITHKHLILKLQIQGWIQDFKVRGGALKKIAPSGGRRENFWGISCEKS
jgi:hypothetical protein